MKNAIARAPFISGAIAAAMTPGELAAQSSTPIRIGTTPQMSVSAALYAQSSGEFQKNGLEPTITPMNSGAAIIAAILGGSLEFGNISMLNLLEAHARALPLMIEYAASLYSSDVKDAIGLIVAKDSPIRSGRDFTGKTLAVPALGDTFTIAGSNWIDKTGGDSSTVKFLELPNSAAAAAIASGRIDAAILVQPTLKNAMAGGQCRIISDPFAAIAPRFVSTVYACSTSFATKNATIVARFRKVINDSSSYVNAHVPEVLPIMSKFTRIDLAVLSGFPFTRMGAGTSLRDARTTIQPLVDVAAKYKVITHSYDAMDLIDPAALA